MSSSSTTLDALANDLDARKPVFVDENGMLISAEEDQERRQTGQDYEATQLKPNTWSWPAPVG